MFSYLQLKLSLSCSISVADAGSLSKLLKTAHLYIVVFFVRADDKQYIDGLLVQEKRVQHPSTVINKSLNFKNGKLSCNTSTSFPIE